MKVTQRSIDPYKRTVIHVVRLIRGHALAVLTIWLVPFLILESSFINQALGISNYLEVFPSELTFPTLMHATSAAFIALIITITKRPRTLGGKVLAAALLGMLFMNYEGRLAAVSSIFRSFMPILPEAGADLFVISLLFLVSMFILVIYLVLIIERKGTRYSWLNSTNILPFVIIVVGVMSFGQVSRLFAVLPTIVRESKTTPSPLEQPKTGQATSELPDIYYIVLDRYTNSDVLRQQFEFENDLSPYLKDAGFTVDDTAYSNYPYTTMSIASTLNADYTNKYVEPYKDNDLQSRTLYHNLIRQSSVIQALRERGYEYYALGSWYGATNRNPMAAQDLTWDHQLHLFSKTKRLRDVESVAFRNSPYYQLAQSGIAWWPLKIEIRSHLEQTKYQLATLKELSRSKEQGGRFIFAHILNPHGPYFFNADGSMASSPGTDNTGKSIKEKYVGQVSFINTQIKELVTSIQTNSNKSAVILLNADEGEYPQFINTTGLTEKPAGQIVEEGVTNGDMSQWSEDWLKMKFGILQAAFIPRANDDDIANLSSVNLFRIVLNRYAGYELTYLPNCHYALNQGGKYEYNYTDITARLRGDSSDACRAKQSTL